MRRRRLAKAPADDGTTDDGTPHTRMPSTSAAKYRTPQHHLMQLCEHSGLVFFERAFAVAICFDSVQTIRREELEDYFVPHGRLSFSFGWPLPAPPLLPARWMIGLPYVFVAASALFGLGLARRAGLAIFTLAFTYLFLCDSARYVNHHYLYCIVGALLLIARCDMPGNGATLRDTLRRCRCRRLHLLLLRAQFVVLYLFATLAKANAEFLVRGEPMRSYLRMGTAPGRPLHALRPWATTETSTHLAATFGFGFDLAATLVLASIAYADALSPPPPSSSGSSSSAGNPRESSANRRRTHALRAVTALSLLFHVANCLLFSTLGSFPLVSLAASALFVQEAPKAAAPPVGTSGQRDERGGGGNSGVVHGVVHWVVSSLWLAAQLLTPLRTYAHRDPSWRKVCSDCQHYLRRDSHPIHKVAVRARSERPGRWARLSCAAVSFRLMADTTDGWVTLYMARRPSFSSRDPAGTASSATPGAEHAGEYDPPPPTVMVYPLTSGGPVTLTSHALQQLLANPRLLEQWVGAEVAAARAQLPADERPLLRAFAECWKSVNGRAFQRWCDPTFDWATLPPARGSVAAMLRDMRAWVGRTPPWMLPRARGAWGGPSAADDAASATAARLRAAGWTVEAFVDVAGRRAWHDKILRSAGYREAWLHCTHGTLGVQPVAARWRPPRPAPSAVGGASSAHEHDDEGGARAGYQVTRLRAGEWVPLRIENWHSLRVDQDGNGPASWLYVMR